LPISKLYVFLMKQKIFFTIGMVVGIAFFVFIISFFLYSQINYIDLIGKRVIIAEGDRELHVVDDNNDVVFIYKIEDWQNGVSEGWEHMFPELISSGGANIGPENFDRFIATSPLPNPRKLGFAISTYTLPIDISLFFELDVRNNRLNPIGEKNRGIIGSIIWSPAETHFAYLLNTKEEAGKYLVVDNVETLEEEFSLDKEDILLALGVEDLEERINFKPRFKGLSFDEEGEFLIFTTSTLDEDESAVWTIRINGTGLTRES